MLAVDEAGEECDEERRGELDQERDAYGQMLERGEVEPLYERDPGDAEQHEEGELPAVDAQALAGEKEQKEEESGSRARGANLGQLERGEAGAENDLGHGPVHSEQRRRGRDHQVAEPRPLVKTPLLRGQEGRVDHRRQVNAS